MIALPTPNAHLFRLLRYAKAYRPQVWSVDQIINFIEEALALSDVVVTDAFVKLRSGANSYVLLNGLAVDKFTNQLLYI